MWHEISLNLVIGLVAGVLATLLVWYFASAIRRAGISVEAPVIANPYGADDNMGDLKWRVRFVRSEIKSRFLTLKNTFCSCQIFDEAGNEIDTPGLLHWERQPRMGAAHPAGLHEQLTSVTDLYHHMLTLHFAHNAPVNIGAGRSDTIDLFFRAEGADYAVPAIARERHIPPGTYTMVLKIEAGNLATPVTKTFKLKFENAFEGFSSERASKTKA